MDDSARQETTFIGEISDPYFSPVITKGLVEFKVRPLQGSPLHHNAAQLISISGESYPVTVRATGQIQPDLSVQPSWQPGDFLVRVDGITFEQAHSMQKLIQEPVTENALFNGDIVSFSLSLTKPGLIELRVRPKPYVSIHRGEASLISKSGEPYIIHILRITPAPPSPILGRFGDLIISVEGISFEQVGEMQSLMQDQNNQDKPKQ